LKKRIRAIFLKKKIRDFFEKEDLRDFSTNCLKKQMLRNFIGAV